MTDLERAIKALVAKGQVYGTLWKYYDGDQPVVYTAKRLEQIFKGVDATFVENWCAVVVDSALERIQLKALKVGDSGAQQALDGIFAANMLNLEADDAHLGTLVTGEAFLIGWREEGGEPELYYNEPEMCHLFYDAERPRVKRFGAKWWNDDEGFRRLTLYYADRLEYFRSKKKVQAGASGSSEWSDKSFEAVGEPAPHDFGEVPVFHLRTGRRATSEISNAVPLQDGVNKLLIDMMVAAEYGAFKQRYVVSQMEIQGQLKNAPNEVWDLPAGDGLGQGTQVGEFTATELRNYFEAIDRLAMAVGVITRTPKHYFYAQSGDPSGEALLAMEAPLNKKCLARIERFTPVWQEAGAFLLRLAGHEVGRSEVRVVFELPETVQPLTKSQARQFDVSSGIPLRTVLRNDGWDEGELAQMDEDRKAEAAASQVGLAAALVEAQRRMDRGEEAHQSGTSG